MRPSRTAVATASSLECAPSLVEMLATWLRTVWTLTTSWAAISLLVSPSESFMKMPNLGTVYLRGTRFTQPAVDKVKQVVPSSDLKLTN